MIPNPVEYNAKTDNGVTGLDKGCNKSLKIPKGIIRIVIQRRTDNTMAKRKRTKGQTTI